MREKTFVLVLAMLLAVGVVSATFTTELVVEKDNIFPGQAAQYELVITNYNSVADRFTISSPEYSYILFITDRPDAPIEPDETGTYGLEITPRNFVNFGTHKVPLEVRSQGSDVVNSVSPILVLRDPNQEQAVYAPSIALSVSDPGLVDPRNDLDLNIGLRNRNARSYEQEELMVRVSSDFFTHTYNTSLGAVGATGEKTATRTIDIDSYKSPGSHPLTVEVLVNGQIISSYESSFEIASFSDIERVVAQDRSFFKTTTSYYLTNNGNVMQTAEVVHPLNAVQQIFTGSTHAFEVDEVDGQRSMVLTEDLMPLEETTITITHNYRLIILLILLAIASVIGYYLMRSPMVLNKEAEVLASIDEGESELKVRLFIKNRSSQTLRNVRIVDRISGLADVIESNDLGTLKPTKVVKKKSKGTLIRWDLDALEPFEERIISYQVKTPLALVGDITLPSLKVTFEQENDRQRTVHSNNVSIRRSE